MLAEGQGLEAFTSKALGRACSSAGDGTFGGCKKFAKLWAEMCCPSSFDIVGVGASDEILLKTFQFFAHCQSWLLRKWYWDGKLLKSRPIICRGIGQNRDAAMSSVLRIARFMSSQPVVCKFRPQSHIIHCSVWN